MPLPGSNPVEIAQYVNQKTWEAYAQLRLPWLRQVEANARALAGRQYDVYDPGLDEFVDLSAIFLPGPERWRQAPVFNWLSQVWYNLSLAKLTENTPLLGALPATSDSLDTQTAALFEPFWRYYWGRLGMPELAYPVYGWLLTAGEAVLKFRWDPDQGLPSEYVSPLDVPVQPDPNPTAPGPLPPVFPDRMGDLAVSVVAPTSVLFPYGPWPHWQAPWVMHEYLVHVDDARVRWNAPDLQPDRLTPSDDLLLRMEYSSFYGNSGSPGGGWGGWINTQVAVKDLVRVRERWERACPDYPYGRFTVVSRETVLDDGINPYVVPGLREKVVIPFGLFRRPGFPFRQQGNSDLENLTPLARARNRALAGGLDFAEHNEQTPLVYNRNLVPDDQVEKLNQVGFRLGVDGDPQRAAAYLNVPNVPLASAEMATMLLSELQMQGHASDSPASTPNDTRSGEFLEQDRFDKDRTWGATLRLSSYEWARCGQIMLDIAAACMEDTRILTIAGQDQALTFTQVRPELLQGRINVYPIPDSAVLETPDGKQARLANTLKVAAELFTVNPLLADAFLRSVGRPELQAALRPGQDAILLAKRQLAEMVQTGQLPPILPEQDHAAHVAVTTDYQQTLAYRNLDPGVQRLVRVYRAMHEAAGFQQQVEQAAKQAEVLEQAAAVTGMPSPSQLAQDQADSARQQAPPKLKRA